MTTDDDIYAALDRLGNYYDRDGNPINFRRFAQLKLDGEHRFDIVGHTFHGPVEISTVRLGWSASTNPDGRPLIFETAVFIGDDPFDEAVAAVLARYATETEAARGHVITIGWYRIHQPLPALTR